MSLSCTGNAYNSKLSLGFFLSRFVYEINERSGKILEGLRKEEKKGGNNAMKYSKL